MSFLNSANDTIFHQVKLKVSGGESKLQVLEWYVHEATALRDAERAKHGKVIVNDTVTTDDE